MHMNTVMKIISFMPLFVLVAIVVFKGWQTKILEEANHLKNTPIDVCQVADGIYDGHSEIGPVIVDVRVSVAAGEIVDIELVKHENGLGEAADAVIEDMIQQNTYDADTLSGATVSSKIIINAVNKALVKGIVSE